MLLIILLVLSVEIVSALECGPPGRPAYGRHQNIAESESYKEGESVSYLCDSGYYMVGPIQRRCLPNGTWTGNMPVCDTTLSPTGYTSASESLSLYPPELAVDANKRSCWYSNRKKPRWWRMDMGQRKSVISVSITVPFAMSEQHFTISTIEVNGSDFQYHLCSTFDGVFSTQSLILVCNQGSSGHILHIEDMLNSLDYFGICEVEVFVYKDIYECGTPDAPTNGIFTFITDHQVEYQCNSGYRLEGGSPVRWCLKTGQWSGGQPICRQVTCPHPEHLENGFFHISGPKNMGKALLGSRITFSCKQGYYLNGNGNESRVCLGNGIWSNSLLPSCEPIDCGVPMEKDSPFLGGKLMLINGTKFKSTAELICYSGIRPGIQITCREDGTWSRLEATCLYQNNVNYLYGSEGFKGSSTNVVAMILAFMVIGVFIAIIVLICYLFKKKILQLKWASEPKPTDDFTSRRRKSSWAMNFLRSNHFNSLGRGFTLTKNCMNNIQNPIKNKFRKVTTVSTTNSSVKSTSSKFEQHIYQEIDKFTASPISAGPSIVTLSSDHAEKIRKAALIAAEIASINEKRRQSGEGTSNMTSTPATVTTAVYAKVDFAQKRLDRIKAEFNKKKDEMKSDDNDKTLKRHFKTFSSPGSIYTLSSQTRLSSPYFSPLSNVIVESESITTKITSDHLHKHHLNASSSGSSGSTSPNEIISKSLDKQIYGLS